MTVTPYCSFVPSGWEIAEQESYCCTAAEHRMPSRLLMTAEIY